MCQLSQCAASDAYGVCVYVGYVCIGGVCVCMVVNAMGCLSANTGTQS